jgi:hypothetical protein
MAAPASTPGVLKLQTNIPATVSLAFADGRPVQSQYSGDQVMFSLDDGRKLYVPPAVANEIGAAGIGAHEPFILTKVETTVGNRRTLRHIVQRVNVNNNNTGPGSAAATTPPGIYTPTATVASTQQPAAANNDPNGKRENAHAIAAELAQELAAPEVGGQLWACFRHAIDVAAAAKKYAAERGLLIDPRFEDIRTIAATMFINANARPRS